MLWNLRMFRLCALVQVSHPLLRVLRLVQALGNTVCSPLSLIRLWPRHPPVFTGICGGDHAGDDTSSYGHSRPLIISTDLWGVSNFQKGRDFCKQTAAWVSAHRQPSNHSIATVLYYLTQDEAPLNGHISETVIGAHPCSWLDVHRVSRLGVQAAESATTDCLALCTTANLPLTE
jgi:hypothetical protein